MSEVCLLPRPSCSRGRAYNAQSQHKHFMKNRFSKSVRNTVAKIPEARAKAFSQRTAVRLTLHFIYLTYIIHISYVLYITYIFYTVFYSIFSKSMVGARIIERKLRSTKVRLFTVPCCSIILFSSEGI